MNATSRQIAVIDFGSQYTQLIVRRVRELGYYARLYAPSAIRETGHPAAMILSGGPRSTQEASAPDIDWPYIQSLGVPVLGVCYGMQLLNLKHHGQVAAGTTREYGPAMLHPEGEGALFHHIAPSMVWMSHSDTCTVLGPATKVIGRNEEGIPVALQFSDHCFGIQFHPEVSHSASGRDILANFLKLATHAQPFEINSFKDELIARIRTEVGSRTVICGVSGGVDSTVLAVLLHEAKIPLRAIFVDHGLLRENEATEVQANFARLGVPIETIDASERFMKALHGEADPEKKRAIIGNLFLDVFWDAVGSEIELFAQGTLYPDVIESAFGRPL
jgi:GMP synthase (glutamine-hydrolysing)